METLDIKNVLDDLIACKASKKALRKYGTDLGLAWYSVDRPAWLVFVLDTLWFKHKIAHKIIDKVCKDYKLSKSKKDKLRLSKRCGLPENSKDILSPIVYLNPWSELISLFTYNFPKNQRERMCRYIRKIVPFSEVMKKYQEMYPRVNIEPDQVIVHFLCS